MKKAISEDFESLFLRYPKLEVCKEDISKAFEILKESFAHDRKLLVCGNGGSAADSEHIVGELMKEFKMKRKIYSDQAYAMMSIDPELGKKIKNLQGNIYSTYGMTETLSHIALRRLNGEKASLHYVPFEIVYLSVTNDDTLVINAPLICSQTLYTNDIVQLHPDGSFVVLGRKDNTINSGGIKIQPEEDERLLQSIIDIPFAITSVSDEKLGEAAVLLIEPVSEQKLDDIKTAMKRILTPYHIPHTIITIQKLPLTGNGKINRKECRKIAAESI